MKYAINFKEHCRKTLSAVEARPDKSNQHELNGVSDLKSILGQEKTTFKVFFSVRGEDASYPVNVTWYDARKKHPTRSEFRLYFQSNPVMSIAQDGSKIIFGKDQSGRFWLELIS